MRFIVVLIMFWPIILLADNGHGHNHGGDFDVDVNNSLTGGDVSLNGGDVAVGNKSESYGFAYGLGDVDLNECMASTQWGTILGGKQKVILNKWCAAEWYDSRGLHTMAAIIRCDIKEIGKHFQTQKECIKANTYKPEPPKPVIIVPPAPEPAEVPAFVEEKHENLEERLARLERSQRAAAIRAQQRRDVAQETYEKVKELREDERDD